MRHPSGVAFAEISASPLRADELMALVDDPRAGAVVAFRGVVRDHDHGVAVRALEYEAHPVATAILHSLLAELSGGDGVVAVGAAHRTGRLEVGDLALLAAVGAEHRGDAFRVCHELVDRIKADLPVWKLQQLADGGSEWVGLT